MSSKPKNKRRVIDYFMSMHYGVCVGPVDEFLAIEVKDKVLFDALREDPLTGATVSKSLGLTTNQTIFIDKSQIFGGDEKEGGAFGAVDLLLGGPSQVMPDDLAKRLVDSSGPGLRATALTRLSEKGRYGLTVPGFRGLTSLFFRGAVEYIEPADQPNGLVGTFFAYAASFISNSESGSTFQSNGFLWTQNSPYVSGVSAKVFRKPVGLDPATSVIVGPDGTKHANPAHIIYEAYTNKVWGLGWPASNFDETWDPVAQVLFDEGFGLSLLWSRQTEIENFVAEIQDHIQAIVYERPDTGKLSIKLIRGDYGAPVFRFDEENCSLSSASRRSLEETTNEINVTWTNPANGEEENLTVQDLGNIANQGRVVSDSRNYYGIQSKTLALRVAARDLRSASYPLFSCRIETGRLTTNIYPGDVVALDWPSLSISVMLLRVMGVDVGRPGSGTVVIEVMEDVFGMALTDYEEPPSTAWEDPSVPLLPFAYEQVFSVPYLMLGDAQRAIEYPNAVVGFFAQSGDKSVMNFVVSSEEPAAGGGTKISKTGTLLQTPVFVLQTGMGIEKTTALTAAQLGAVVGIGSISLGDFFYIGTSDTESEVLQIIGYNATTKAFTLGRGMLDTVPHEWGAGSRVWLIEDSFNQTDPVSRFAGIEQSYWLRPRSFSETLNRTDAPQHDYTPVPRAHMPFRPVDLRIDGNSGWGVVDYSVTTPAEIVLTWKQRNRLSEDSTPLNWNEASASPETGVTITVRVENIAGTMLVEYTGLTGDSFNLPLGGATASVSQIVIYATAVLEGVESLQVHKRIVLLPDTGYGLGYGLNYGGF